MVGSSSSLQEKPSRTLSLDLDKGPGPTPPTASQSGSTSSLGGSQGRGADSPSSGRRRLGRPPLTAQPPDTKVLVFWLESFEDALQLPISKLT